MKLVDKIITPNSTWQIHRRWITNFLNVCRKRGAATLVSFVLAILFISRLDKGEGNYEKA